MNITTTYLGLKLDNPIIAGSSGLTGSAEQVKALAANGAGADAVQMASCLYKHGPAYEKEMLDGLKTRMNGKNYRSLSGFKGKLSQARSSNPAVYERAQFMRYFGGKKTVIA